MKRLCKSLPENASKQEEIDKFKKFYNECSPNTYLRQIMDNAGMTPVAVEDAIKSDFGFVR